ncbi:MAG: hypothetical protein OQL19_17260 [Gammaproteobacteria bacterium]|nr:hypothetical protein [Gammaproteobacteria bacterium]
MPNQIIWEKEGVLSCYSGVFRPEDHIEGLNKLFGDQRIDGIKYIIGDYSEVNGDLLREESVEYPVAMTTGAASYVRDIKVALVAKDEKIIMLCRHFIELSNKINPGWEVKLFVDIQGAREWISSCI